MNLRSVSFQLRQLPPDSRVLALCLICLASLVSFHESVLGDGPRPESFEDTSFFWSNPELFRCGVRRSQAYRALRVEAFRAAWEAGTILQASITNAASCFVLDLLEQSICISPLFESFLTVIPADSSGLSRPWGSAYMSHIRALAPTLRGQKFTLAEARFWAAFFVGDFIFALL